MNYDELLKALAGLTNDEKETLVKTVMGMMTKEDEIRSCDNLIKEHSNRDCLPDCPHCGAQAKLGCIVKRGRKGNGAQRYTCKSCQRHFVGSTGTVFEGTHKKADVWEKYIQMTLDGKSLKVCASECHIAYQTAFTWRHKILNAFRVHQEATMMTGRVEMDEMLIPISYKGNHIKGKFGDVRKSGKGVDNNLPRSSYKRGSDNKSTSSKEKACVFCMIKNGSEGFYAAVPGVGFMQPEMLNATVGKHVNKENATLLVDQYKVTKNYLEENNYRHIILAANTSDNPHDHKPEIRDGYHLQHVNSFHHHLRNFLRNYHGVSTKYLENYVSLYIWLKTIAANKQKKHINQVSISRVSDTDCYVTRKELKNRPAIPVCA